MSNLNDRDNGERSVAGQAEATALANAGMAGKARMNAAFFGCLCKSSGTEMYARWPLRMATILVIPAWAGIQIASMGSWTPACAGVTESASQGAIRTCQDIFTHTSSDTREKFQI